MELGFFVNVFVEQSRMFLSILAFLDKSQEPLTLHPQTSFFLASLQHLLPCDPTEGYLYWHSPPVHAQEDVFFLPPPNQRSIRECPNNHHKGGNHLQ